AVPRLHPTRAGTRPLPQVRRGRVRALGRRRLPRQRRERAPERRVMYSPARSAHPLPREPRPGRDAGPRRVPAGRLTGRGLLPRRQRRSGSGRLLMPHIERTAHVGWDGNLARGAGTLDAVSGAFARLPFSLPSRVGDPGGKTSPEELLAAAHGGCITMSLAGELTAASTPPGRL